MPKYRIDFSRMEYGSMEIEADSYEDAEYKFWSGEYWEYFEDKGETDINETILLEQETQATIK